MSFYGGEAIEILSRCVSDGLRGCCIRVPSGSAFLVRSQYREKANSSDGFCSQSVTRHVGKLTHHQKRLDFPIM